MISIQEHISLAPYTYFKVGGQARYFVEAKTEKEVLEVVQWARDKHIPVVLLGAGSNVLVSDRGIDGLVIRPLLTEIVFRNDTMYVGAGVSMAKAATAALEHNISGFEWAVGIPGTIGGSVYGNAGCFGGEMKDAIECVRVLELKTEEDKIYEIENATCGFGYRESIFKKNKNMIILGATFKLKRISDEEKKEKRAWVQRMMQERVAEQAIGEHTAGSTFKGIMLNEKTIAMLRFHDSRFQKPKESCWIFENRAGRMSAGFLIERAGLKKKNVGGVSVSEKHANFFINDGTATAENIIILIDIVKEYVHRKFGIFLEEEIQYLGY